MSVLDKYGVGTPGTFAKRLGRDREEDVVLSEDFPCYGVLRGNRDRAIHLQLIKKDGRILAPAYAWISRLEYDPAGQITLHTAEHTITVSGRGLNKPMASGLGLFDALSQHRVRFVRESEKLAGLQQPEDENLIETINW